MDLLTTLAARAGSFIGHGVNHEKEAFTGRLVVSRVMAGRAVTLHYTALGLDGQTLHEEFTLLSQPDQGGCASGGDGRVGGGHAAPFAGRPRRRQWRHGAGL